MTRLLQPIKRVLGKLKQMRSTESEDSSKGIAEISDNQEFNYKHDDTI